MKPYVWITGVLFAIAFLPEQAFGKEVVLERAGTLQDHFTPDEIKNTTFLTLKGNIDIQDFQFLWSLPVLTELDISKIRITAKNGSPENTIPTSAFWGKKTLQKVLLPSTLTAIANYAFYGCTGLSSIDFPPSLTSMGAGAFSLCDSLKTIDFTGCPLLKRIGERAFTGCSSLQRIILPVNLKKIENRLFKNCTRLESVVIPDSLTLIENEAFDGCGSLREIRFPATLAAIGNEAFESCSNLSSVTFPSGLKSIGNAAFGNCTSLQEIFLPASVTDLSPSAFRSCTVLTAITVDTGNAAFKSNDGIVYKDEGKTLYIYPCGKKGDFTLPLSVTNVQQEVFYRCIFLDAIHTDDRHPLYKSNNGVLFSKDGRTLLDYPRGRKGIYQLPATVRQIGSSAFSGSDCLTGIEIPQETGLQKIGERAFYNCPELTKMDLGTAFRLTEIGSSAFGDCGSLNTVVFPATLQLLRNNAFHRCTALQNIEFLGKTPPACGNGVFENIGTECNITVPEGAGKEYGEIYCFRDRYDIKEIPLPSDTE